MKFAKAQKGDGGAASTQDKGFGPGSKKGIPASTMKGKVGPSGKKATFKSWKENGEEVMCKNCGCGYASYDDLETGAPANEPWPWTASEEKRETTEAQ